MNDVGVVYDKNNSKCSRFEVSKNLDQLERRANAGRLKAS